MRKFSQSCLTNTVEIWHRYRLWYGITQAAFIPVLRPHGITLIRLSHWHKVQKQYYNKEDSAYEKLVINLSRSNVLQ